MALNLQLLNRRYSISQFGFTTDKMTLVSFAGQITQPSLQEHQDYPKHPLQFVVVSVLFQFWMVYAHFYPLLTALPVGGHYTPFTG